MNIAETTSTLPSMPISSASKEPAQLNILIPGNLDETPKPEPLVLRVPTSFKGQIQWILGEGERTFVSPGVVFRKDSPISAVQVTPKVVVAEWENTNSGKLPDVFSYLLSFNDIRREDPTVENDPPGGTPEADA
jgi:hypothetical protein